VPYGATLPFDGHIQIYSSYGAIEVNAVVRGGESGPAQLISVLINIYRDFKAVALNNIPSTTNFITAMSSLLPLETRNGTRCRFVLRIQATGAKLALCNLCKKSIAICSV
jgi:hypothetical protein